MDLGSILFRDREEAFRIGVALLLISFLAFKLAAPDLSEKNTSLWINKEKALVASQVYPLTITPLDNKITVFLNSTKDMESFQVSLDGGITWAPFTNYVQFDSQNYKLVLRTMDLRYRSFLSHYMGLQSLNKIRSFFIRGKLSAEGKYSQPLSVVLFYDKSRPDNEKGPQFIGPLQITQSASENKRPFM